MSDISKIDKNFTVETELNLPDVVFYDVKENPFCLFGAHYENGCYRRIPEALAKALNPRIEALHTNTSGARLRFMTDSPYVAISAVMPPNGPMTHMANTGSAGFDMYLGERYVQNFVPPCPFTREGYDSVRDLPGEGLREVTVNFPLYHNVYELRLGLKEGARFLPIPEEKVGKKVLFYGSSITQGGCASRPGSAFPNLLAHKLGFDLVCLGFSGNAKGEDEMCDYIAEQAPDVFVYDYDHNAPTYEHLEKTHERFFLRFREAHPDTPVIMLSAPNALFNPSWFFPRRDMVKKTYENAVARGDENVYFIDGSTLFGDDWYLCTVDGCHPNDLGHYRMAMGIAPVLKPLL